MSAKIAAVVTSYNMPERTDALANYIRENVRWPIDLFVVDNGSDLAEPAKSTNVWIKQNVQTTAGWLRGLEAADATGEKYLAYLFLITSTEFVGGDPITPMAYWLVDHPDAVGIHPALTPDSTTSWGHLYARGGDPRRTWMIDNICALYRADWFDRIGRFDPRMTYAWGIDLETCYIARVQKRTLWVDERVSAKKVTDIGYAMNRMGMTAEERRERAGYNMRSVLLQKYGPDFWHKMTEERVTDELR